MKEVNYWNDFMHSGRIEDYLSYKESIIDDIPEEKTTKEAGYAGFFNRDGNGIEDNPYRGIR